MVAQAEDGRAEADRVERTAAEAVARDRSPRGPEDRAVRNLALLYGGSSRRADSPFATSMTVPTAMAC